MGSAEGANLSVRQYQGDRYRPSPSRLSKSVNQIPKEWVLADGTGAPGERLGHSYVQEPSDLSLCYPERCDVQIWDKGRWRRTLGPCAQSIQQNVILTRRVNMCYETNLHISAHSLVAPRAKILSYRSITPSDSHWRASIACERTQWLWVRCYCVRAYEWYSRPSAKV